MKAGEATFEDWLKALENNRYRQVAARLGAFDIDTRKPIGNCCLGVMCRVNRFPNTFDSGLAGFGFNALSAKYTWRNRSNSLSPEFDWCPIIAVMPVIPYYFDMLGKEVTTSTTLNGALVRFNDQCICGATMVCPDLKNRHYRDQWGNRHGHMFNFKFIARVLRDHLAYYDVPTDTKLTAPVPDHIKEAAQKVIEDGIRWKEELVDGSHGS